MLAKLEHLTYVKLFYQLNQLTLQKSIDIFKKYMVSVLIKLDNFNILTSLNLILIISFHCK